MQPKRMSVDELPVDYVPTNIVLHHKNVVYLHTVFFDINGVFEK